MKLILDLFPMAVEKTKAESSQPRQQFEIMAK